MGSKILKADNWFFTGVTKLVLLIVINAMFLIGCIPIFTIGASYSGLYYAVNKNLKFDRGYSFRCFWEGFKDSFKQSTIANLIFLAISMVLLGDVAVIQTFAQQGKINEGFSIFFMILLALVWLFAIWVFAYVATFQNSLKNIFQNCIKLFVAEMPTTLYAAVIMAFVAFIIWLIPPTVFVMPGVGVWFITMRMQRSFRKYMTQEQREKEDEINQFKVYDDRKL